jgi:hypothetical protein
VLDGSRDVARQQATSPVREMTNHLCDRENGNAREPFDLLWRDATFDQRMRAVQPSA